MDVCIMSARAENKRPNKRSPFVCDTCNGTGGEGKCRDAMKEGANREKVKLTSLVFLPYFTQSRIMSIYYF
jgi:hypothetical protein